MFHRAGYSQEGEQKSTLVNVPYWHKADAIRLNVRYEQEADHGLGYINGVYFNCIRTIV